MYMSTSDYYNTVGVSYVIVRGWRRGSQLCHVTGNGVVSYRTRDSCCRCCDSL